MEYANIFFAVIFIVEMPLQIFGLGLRNYFTDFFNSFDAFIALISLVDIILSNFVVKLELGGVTTLRTFRLLRLFKLAKSWK
jgi:hypothetical protein